METDELDMDKYWEVYDENIKKNPICPPIKIVFYKKLQIRRKSLLDENPISTFRKEYKAMIRHFYTDSD
jgi:hypothetical protein